MPLWGKIFASIWIIAGIFLAGSLISFLLPVAYVVGFGLIAGLFFSLAGQPIVLLCAIAGIAIFTWIMWTLGSAFVGLFWLLVQQWAPKSKPEPTSPQSPE